MNKGIGLWQKIAQVFFDLKMMVNDLNPSSPFNQKDHMITALTFKLFGEPKGAKAFGAIMLFISFMCSMTIDLSLAYIAIQIAF